MGREKSLSVAAEVLGIVVLVIAGTRTGKLLRTYTVKTSEIRASLVGGLAKPGIELGNLDGIALNGRYVDPASDDRTRIVFFLLRDKNAASDLRFWNRVTVASGGNPWLQFRGFCEAVACKTAARSQRDMLVFQAGAVRTVEAVLQADGQGSAVLVTAADRREVGDIAWRNVRSPARVETEILAAINGPIP
ncbi:MAG: hypothetical protein EPN33_04270 [Acidobacteria bacterium]|nr:MAG: hypothetical protein EPN33_04270 [Acidobacteriota bacterium]